MATVSTLLSDLGQAMNDPDQNTFTAAFKLVELNRAQLELVAKLLGFGSKHNGVYDLLSDIVEKEIKSIDTTGIALSGLSRRNFIANGLIQTQVTIGGKDRFPVRYALDDYGISENSFLRGSDSNPVIRVDSGRIYLDISVGSYPKDLTVWYVGEPFQMAAAASGSGKTQLVATPDLNETFHPLLVTMAQRRLLLDRGDADDVQTANQLKSDINEWATALARGQDITPKSETVGQFKREDQNAV